MTKNETYETNYWMRATKKMPTKRKPIYGSVPGFNLYLASRNGQRLPMAWFFSSIWVLLDPIKVRHLAAREQLLRNRRGSWKDVVTPSDSQGMAGALDPTGAICGTYDEGVGTRVCVDPWLQ